MKSKDIPVLVLVVGISVLVSYFVTNLVFGQVGTQVTKVERVEPVTADFSYENKSYYKANPEHPELPPLNPTIDITVNENSNQKPLN